MIETIKQSDFVVMPWKNGLGVTSQIDIYPPQAIFPEDFLWRISSAKIDASAPFSEFHHYDRYLAILQGDGLMLNDSKLALDEIIRFKGETPIFAKLIGGSVTDLGIIFHRDFVECSMNQLILPAGHSSTIETTKKINYIFCAEGVFAVYHKKISSGDCLKVSNVDQIELTAGPQQDTRLFLIQISLKEKAGFK
ncbi:MAG: HutD family protein [Bdellovibrio sp.]